MHGPDIVGIGIGVGIVLSTLGASFPNTTKSKVEPCIASYFADKYNGSRQGEPSKTFLACMQVNFSDEFKNLSEKYKPADAVGAVAAPSQA